MPPLIFTNVGKDIKCKSQHKGSSFSFDLLRLALSSTLGVALGCRASAIIYQNTRVYGDYQLIIAINASTRQLNVEPNATSTENMPEDMREESSNMYVSSVTELQT